MTRGSVAAVTLSEVLLSRTQSASGSHSSVGGWGGGVVWMKSEETGGKRKCRSRCSWLRRTRHVFVRQGIGCLQRPDPSGSRARWFLRRGCSCVLLKERSPQVLPGFFNDTNTSNKSPVFFPPSQDSRREKKKKDHN